ncbi:MAG: hypothetical protein M1840_006885 [Geoglossum simile]|nr:MAG: hypothetical protein M1840_006885 [Geoglossum simile]
MASRRLLKPALFICDLQEKFRSAIWEYPSVIDTTKKMITASQILKIPVYATTQSRTKLGKTCSELNLENVVEHVDKSLFSMWVPDIQKHFRPENGPHEIAIVGIESHICVMQTTLDLLANGHKVYVLADGVSSCNPQEVPIALDRLRREGAVITTSESFLFECMGNANVSEFKQVSALVRDTKSETKSSLETLCKI